jgi:hypothetical protein
VSNGKPFLPGYMPGSEAVIPNAAGTGASGWMNLTVAAQVNGKPADFNLAEGTMRYLVFNPQARRYDHRPDRPQRDCEARISMETALSVNPAPVRVT